MLYLWMVSDKWILTEQIHIISNKYVHLKIECVKGGKQQQKESNSAAFTYIALHLSSLDVRESESGLKDVTIYTETAWEALFR